MFRREIYVFCGAIDSSFRIALEHDARIRSLYGEALALLETSYNFIHSLYQATRHRLFSFFFLSSLSLLSLLSFL